MAAAPAMAMATAVVAVALAGCGGRSEDRRFDQKVVPAALVDRQPPGSPSRAALELVRAMQFNDASASARGLAPELGLSAERLAQSLPAGLAQATDLIGSPRVVASTIAGDTAVLRVVWGAPARVQMRRVGGRWTVAAVDLEPAGAGAAKATR